MALKTIHDKPCLYHGTEPRPQKRTNILTVLSGIVNIQSLRSNNTRPASAGFGRSSAPRRVTLFLGASA